MIVHESHDEVVMATYAAALFHVSFTPATKPAQAGFVAERREAHRRGFSRQPVLNPKIRAPGGGHSTHLRPALHLAQRGWNP